MSKITNETLEEIEREFLKWAKFMNNNVGIPSFCLGISCLGTQNPGITGIFSLAFMLLFMGYGQHRFPQKLRELRKASLLGINEVLLLGIEQKYFSFRNSFRRFPIFNVGWLFLAGVALYGTIGQLILK